MKNSFFILVLGTIIMFSCKSPSKLLDDGNYDKVIDRCVKKMLKGNAKAEDMLMLDKAYQLANQQDNESIRLLKSEGRPENWERIYFAYNRLDWRQKEVRKVLPFEVKGKTYNYTQIDYTPELVESKNKTADYFYALGNRLMANKTKESYRNAYHNFVKAKGYNENGFPDILERIDEAQYLGTTRVLVEVRNVANVQLPADFYDKLLSFNTSQLNSSWVDYYIGRTDRTTQFDFYINIDLVNFFVSPERFTSTEYIRTRRVEDGFEYVLDSRGNVRKDSLGNDIKVPRYKDLKCTVTKREQKKEATIEVQMEYFQSLPRKVIKREQMAATSVFEHVSGKAFGDTKALQPEDLELIKRDPAPFPDDISMFYNCIPALQQSIENSINQNRSLIY